MISDNKRIECCCHVAYAARTVAGMLDHITLHVRDVGRSIAFYEHALAPLAVGGRDNGAPGPRPYHPGYYSAFVLDPDGNNIEAVVDWAGWFENHR